MAVQAEEPPKGFESENWEALCKIDCKDTDLLSVSHHLKGQTLSRVAEVLRVSFSDTELTQEQDRPSHHAHHRLLTTWRKDKIKASLGDLFRSLSKLDDNGLLEKLKAIVKERVTGITIEASQ